MQTKKQIDLKKHAKQCYVFSGVALYLMLTACGHSISSHGASKSNAVVPIISINTCEIPDLKVLDANFPLAGQTTLNEILFIYNLPNTNINKEIKKLGDSDDEATQIKKALLLSRTLSSADSKKALNILADVIAEPITSDNESEILLARFVYPIIEDQHKAYQLLSQQNKQIKENTQEIESLKNKLKALRAIEDSINSRPPETDTQN